MEIPEFVSRAFVRKRNELLREEAEVRRRIDELDDAVRDELGAEFALDSHGFATGLVDRR